MYIFDIAFDISPDPDAFPFNTSLTTLSAPPILAIAYPNVFENGSSHPGKMVSNNCKRPKMKSIGKIVATTPDDVDCGLLHIVFAKEEFIVIWTARSVPIYIILIRVNMVSGILYLIIVNISVIIKNAKIEVDGSGGAVEVFVVGNVLGDCNSGSMGAGAGGSFVVDADVVDDVVVDAVVDVDDLGEDIVI